MGVPNYRETIARVLFGQRYRPPYDGLSDTDTIHNEEPYNPAVVGIDMDIKRIDRAILAAQEKDFERISVYILREQLAFMENRYNSKIDIHVVSIKRIKHVLQQSADLYESENKPYIAQGGGYLYAVDFNTSKKIDITDKT